MKVLHAVPTFALLLLLLAGQGFAQQKGHIQGRVVDEQTKQPMIGAYVTLMGTTLGAATDTEGIFRIENLREEVYKLTVSTSVTSIFSRPMFLLYGGKQPTSTKSSSSRLTCPASRLP